MATFTYSYDKSKPAGDDLISASDDFFRDQWEAIEERQAIEHKPYAGEIAGVNKDDAGSAGMHKPGHVSAVAIDSKSNLDTTGTYPAISGRLAVDETNNVLAIHNGTNWSTHVVQLSTNDGLQACSVYLNAAQTISANSTKVLFVHEYFDHGTNFNTGTSIFTAPYAGLYQMDVTLQPTTALDAGKYIYPLIKNNTTAAQYGGNYGTFSGIIALAASNQVQVNVSQAFETSPSYNLQGVLSSTALCRWTIYCVGRQ